MADSLSKVRRDLRAHITADNAALGDIQKSLAMITKQLDPSPENEHYVLRPIENTLRPITATYNTANQMGKWVMTALVIVSLFVGIVWAVLQIVATKVHIHLP